MFRCDVLPVDEAIILDFPSGFFVAEEDVVVMSNMDFEEYISVTRSDC